MKFKAITFLSLASLQNICKIKVFLCKIEIIALNLHLHRNYYTKTKKVKDFYSLNSKN